MTDEITEYSDFDSIDPGDISVDDLPWSVTPTDDFGAPSVQARRGATQGTMLNWNAPASGGIALDADEARDVADFLEERQGHTAVDRLLAQDGDPEDLADGLRQAAAFIDVAAEARSSGPDPRGQADEDDTDDADDRGPDR